MEQKKTFFVIIFLSIFSINLISAVTLNSGTITSIGLNSTINITFSLTFDLLNLSNDSITFYNLSYVHPSSCGQSSSYSVYSYTTSNQNTTLDQVLPSISCPPAASNAALPSSSSSQTISTPSNWQVTLTPGNVSVLNFSNFTTGFDSILALSEMDISVNGTGNTSVLVNRYYTSPPGIPNLSSQVYQYLQISFSNPIQVLPILQNANLIFKVNKSWVSNNNLTPNNISIYKLDNLSNNNWVGIPTIYNGLDNNFYYYQTNVSSFSYFAIGVSIDNTQQNQGSSVPFSLGKNNNSTLLVLIIIVILIIGALVLLIIKKKKKEYRF